MSLSALALVLSAALLHVLWNLAAKRAGASGVAFVWSCSALSALMWAPLALGVHADVLPALGLVAWGAILASGLIHVAYFLVLLRAYELADLSVVYPVARGSGPLLSGAVAVAVLGEPFSFFWALGLLLIVSGTFVIAGGSASGAASGVASDANRRRIGITWGLATGVLIAAYTLNDGLAVSAIGVPPLLFDWLGIVARAIILAPFALRRISAVRSVFACDAPTVAVVALLSPLAYILVLQAMTLAPLSHVAPAREVSMLFAAAFGARLLGEGALVRRLSGAALIATGVVALVLPV